MFEWVRRVGMAVYAGAQHAVQQYKEAALAPITPAVLSMTDAEWDSFDSRLFRYWHYDLYYFNEAFSQLERYRLQHLRQRGLYKHTRGIYNPVFRLVNITASKCYGGVLNWKDLETGAIPLMDATPSHKTAVRELWLRSNMGQLKMLYARRLARYGDGVLKIVDDRDKGQVRIESLHPGVIKDATFDAVGYVQAYTIEYARPDPRDPDKLVLYRETGDKEAFRTFIVRSGEKAEPFAWYRDADGKAVSAWANDYGFVPLVITPAMNVGQSWGATTFAGGVIHKIDEANDLASNTHDQIRKLVDALYYFAGVQNIKQITSSAQLAAEAGEEDNSDRDEVRFLTGPANSQPTILSANLDFSGALDAVQKLLDEIEHDLPELAFSKLREYQLHSNPAVLSSLGDAIDRLEDFNGNADHGLLRALQMGISVGAWNNYPGFEAFSIDSYHEGGLNFQIRPRDIVADKLSKKERLDFLIQTDAPPSWIWEELDIDAARIAAGEADRIQRDRQVAADVASVLAGGMGMNDDDEEPETAP